MNTHIGIVLKKNIPAKRTIVLLDKELGRIEYVTLVENICLGALIQYQVRCVGSMSIVEQIEKIDIPLLRSQEDILFFHHVLELCFHFIPYTTSVIEIFTLLHYLYTADFLGRSLHHKKIFLVKFFTLLGIYPEDKQIHEPWLYRIAGASIDMIIEQDLHLESSADINTWLRGCIGMHPRSDVFKTIHFLDESINR